MRLLSNIFHKPLPIVYGDVKDLKKREFRHQDSINGRDWITKINGEEFVGELSVKITPKHIKVLTIFKQSFYDEYKDYCNHSKSMQIEIFDKCLDKVIFKSDTLLNFIGFDATDGEVVKSTYFFSYINFELF